MRKALGALALLALLSVPLLAYAEDGARPPTAGVLAAPGGVADGAEVQVVVVETGADAAGEDAAEPGADAGESVAEPAPGGCPDCNCACADCNSASGTLEFYGPNAVINTHPPNLLFLQPPPASAIALTPGERYAQFGVHYTNIIIREKDNGSQIFYDFEGLRAAFEYHQGFEFGELSAQLPLYYRGTGFLDGLMADWHGWFGLPNGLRDRYPDNRYHYVLVRPDGLIYADGGNVSGTGDLSVGLKRQLWNRRDGQDAAALRVMLKAPTGDPGFALGSGGWDVSFGALYQRQLRPHLRAYANVDYVLTGQPGWDNIEHNNLLLTQWTLECSISPRTTVQSMYRTNTNPLRMGSKEGDKDAQELGFGFSHRVSKDIVWTGGFTEDIYPETAPDFVVTTDMKWSF